MTFTCLSAFIFVQVLEAHGLRPISLKPKEVKLKGNHAVNYLLPSDDLGRTVFPCSGARRKPKNTPFQYFTGNSVLLAQGLALINGTQMITSLGAEAVERAQAIARQADIIAALTLEVLKGTTKAFDSGELASWAHAWREAFLCNLSLSASVLPSALILKTSTSCVPTRAR